MIKKDQEEILSMFASKYGNSNPKDETLLKQSLNRLLSKRRWKHDEVAKLKTSLAKSQSQTQAHFFPTLEDKKEPSKAQAPAPAPAPSQPPKLSLTPASQQQDAGSSKFMKRQIPFQRTFLKQDQTDRVSEESEKSPKSIYFVDRQDEDEWAALMKLDAKLYEKEKIRRKQLQAQQKQRLKEELDQQLLAKAQQREREKKEDNFYRDFSNELLQQQYQKEREKKLAEQLRVRELQKERDLQVRLQKRQRVQDERENQLYKQQLNKRYEEDSKKETEAEQKLKLSKRDYMYRVMKQSEYDKALVQRKLKEEEKLQEEQYAKYGQLLDQIEAKKLEEARMRQEKVNQVKAFSEQQLQKYRLESEDDSKFRLQKQKEEAQFQEEQRRKEQRVREMKMRTIQTLEEQIENKKQRSLKEKDIDRLQGQVWREDTDRYQKEEHEKQERIRTIKLQHRNLLEQQICEKKKPERGDKMTIPELLQNKTTLKSIREQEIYDLDKFVI